VSGDLAGLQRVWQVVTRVTIAEYFESGSGSAMAPAWAIDCYRVCRNTKSHCLLETYALKHVA